MSDNTWYVFCAQRRTLRPSGSRADTALHKRHFVDEASAKKFAAEILAQKMKVYDAGTLEGVTPPRKIEMHQVKTWCAAA